AGRSRRWAAVALRAACGPHVGAPTPAALRPRTGRPRTDRRVSRVPASPQPPPPGAEAVELLILDADGVLTDGGIWVDDSGRQMRRYSVRDGLAIGAWQRLGFKVAIISG